MSRQELQKRDGAETNFKQTRLGSSNILTKEYKEMKKVELQFHWGSRKGKLDLQTEKEDSESFFFSSNKSLQDAKVSHSEHRQIENHLSEANKMLEVRKSVEAT